MRRRLLTPPQRAAARIVTGPAAHLYGGAVDWLLLVGRYAAARARGKRLD